MTANEDIRGVKRGRCRDVVCDCDSFLRLPNIEGQGWCNYCGHPPTKHALLDLGLNTEPPPATTVFRAPTEQKFEPRVASAIRDYSAISHDVSTVALANSSTFSGMELANVSFSSRLTSTPAAKVLVDQVSIKEPNVPSAIGDVTLPRFTDFVKPLLDGSPVTLKEERQMWRQLRDELICHMDVHNIATRGNKANLKWEYYNVGKLLYLTYPKLQWERKKANVKYSASKPWSVFTRRLSSTRKVRTWKSQRPQLKREEIVLPSPANMDPAEASRELERMALTMDPEQLFDVERVCLLLDITADERAADPPRQLPPYLLNQFVLEHEAKRRFGDSTKDLAKTLEEKINLCQELLHNEQPTIKDLDKFFLPKTAVAEFISLDPYTVRSRLPGPKIFACSDSTCIYASAHETITLNGASMVEAAILCLSVYHVKDISYPATFWPILSFLQKAVLPNCPLQGRLSKKLKSVLTVTRLL